MDALLVAAVAARDHALPTFSGVKVGAALQTAAGVVVTGCNVESPSIIFHCCAERVALLKALSEGHRQFVRIAVVGDFNAPLPPCGTCRQALFEYAPDLEVTMANLTGQTATLRLADLLPASYRIDDRRT
ncbi:MAG: cytidine deaminase [Deltaproteobacteria bacterium]|nr:cytidine deaminase [Deltaproteobacteria bacterium]